MEEIEESMIQTLGVLSDMISNVAHNNQTAKLKTIDVLLQGIIIAEENELLRELMKNQSKVIIPKTVADA